jgi:predicted Zn-dependent protease
MIESDNAKGSGYEVGMRLDEFVPENAGSNAAMSAIKSRYGIRVPSGKYKLILGPQPVADLLGNIILPSLNLAVVDAASSAFSGKYGTSVVDRRISIYDDGSLSDYPMSRRYTCEGLATGRTELIKDGVLTGYLSNNYYRNKVLHDSSAKDKIGADPAGITNALIPRNGFRSGESMLRCFRGRPSIVPTNVIVETSGAIPSDELVRMVGDGIYIGRIWYTYPINGLLAGDFTCTVVGDSYIIEGGRITEPLKPNSIRIADNIRNLLNQVIGATKDRKPVLLWGSPEVIYSPDIAVQDINLFSIGG